MPKQNKIFLSIVIPCYNEKENIPLVLSRFNQLIKNKDVEIIMVDNGSTDGSSKILHDLIPKYPFARLEKVKKNEGYGNGILAGLSAAKGQYLGWTHADMQTDPKDTLTALKIIRKTNIDHIFVKGKRSGRSFFDNLFTVSMSLFESILLGTPLWDINGQPTFFSRSFYESWSEAPKDFALDLYVYALAKRFKLRIIRFPVKFPERIHGFSSWNNGLMSKYKLIKRTLGFSLKLRQVIKNKPKFLPEFIAHRINTVSELNKLPDHFGVELDVRDRDNGKIIIEHEPFKTGENFEDYLKSYHHGTMIINVKSERIELKILELLKKHHITNYFFLDSSFPMVSLLSNQGENKIALRYSEFEGLDTILTMKNKVKWVWVDCFTKLPLDQESFRILKDAGFKLCLVSPELQGRIEDIEKYKNYLRNENVSFDAICTKSYNIDRWL